MDAQYLLLAAAAVFVVAGAVKGITGMGLPTVAMSLLGLLMPPAQAAALLVAPSLATNLAQCAGANGRRLARRLWPMWAGLAAATLWGPGLGGSMSAAQTQLLLGTVLLAYGSWGLVRPRLARRTGPAAPTTPAWAAVAAGGPTASTAAVASSTLPAGGGDGPSARLTALVTALGIGLLTGLVTAATAVFVMPLVPYLQTLRLDKDAMVQALGLSFTIATVALAWRLQAAGTPMLLSADAALALAAAFVGLWLGSRVRARLSGPAFQRALYIVFVGAGAASFWKALA